MSVVKILCDICYCSCIQLLVGGGAVCICKVVCHLEQVKMALLQVNM